MGFEITLATLESVFIDTDLYSPQSVGNDIIVSAQTVGGTDNEYRFEAYIDDDTMPCATRDYASSATWVWSPSLAGVYKLKVLAREGSAGEPVSDEQDCFTIN